MGKKVNGKFPCFPRGARKKSSMNLSCFPHLVRKKAIAVELRHIVIIIVVLLLMVGFIIIAIKRKGFGEGGILDSIKNMLRFGRGG